MIARGEQLSHAKLNSDRVRAIRSNPRGWPAHRWAREFGVHVRTIDAVCSFKNWRHVR